MLKRLFRPEREHRVVDEATLAANLSFVLHERSDSAAVQSAVQAVRSHANIVRRLSTSLSSPVIPSTIDYTDVSLWFSATIGIPHLLASALNVPQDRVVLADSDAISLQPVAFYRAQANLILPSTAPRRVGVAALLLRPDRRTSHLAVAGVHAWPSDAEGAIRSLERLIQAHAGQWMPPRALWSAPAEILLPDEVY